MSFCVVNGCKNRKSKKNWEQEEIEKSRKENISFHMFPKDIEKQKKWLAALNLINYTPCKSAAVCSVHFKNSDYVPGAAIKKLQSNAVPHVSISIRVQVNQGEEKSGNESTAGGTIECFQNDPNNKLINNESVIVTSEDNIVDIPENVIRYHNQSTNISPKRVLNSPTKKQIRDVYTEKIKTLQRQLYKSRYKKKETTKKLYKLKSILKHLQSKFLLSKEDSDILQHLTAGTQDLVKREIRLKKNLPVSRKFNPSIRQFALSLHYYSPKAYSYVRHKFYNALPHPKTLSKWYRTVGGEPGLNSEALDCIKRQACMVSYKLVGALIFDEIAIRQHVDYYKDKFIGYVNCGEYIECDTTQLAKEALVFCVVCINQSWKLPISYYLISGLNTEQKKNLIIQSLIALNESGILITSVTCDGLSTNINVLQSLGCDFNTKGMRTWFKHPSNDSKVFVFLDPSHMLKLVRNVLGNTKIILDENGNAIKWEHLEALHTIQQVEGLHLGNKLSHKHIAFHHNKMKVKLATQLLSTSVSNSLQFLKDCLKLKEFQDCEPLITFIQTFNNLFDIFNSKSIRQYGLKKPVNSKNHKEIFEKLSLYKAYICNLKHVKEKRNIIDSRVKTGFLGFLINIESLIEMYQFTCVDNNLLQYIPTYKISQDHLELLFGYIRSMSGYNNNPTAKQFFSAFRKLIVHTEINENDTGNCVLLENIPILNNPSTSLAVENPIDIINSSAQKCAENQWLDVFRNTETDHDYSSELPLIVNNSEYRTEVLNYISGYILKKLINTLRCTECIQTLMAESPNMEICNLINVKNRGPLLYPSTDLSKVCKIVEEKIRQYIHINNTLESLNIKVFTNSILRDFISSKIFQALDFHVNDQNIFDNHKVQLLKLIIQTYAKTRFTHYIKQSSISDRHKLTKLIIFKGQ